VAVADLAIASTEATFAFTETRLGIIPAVVAPYVVRKIGPGHATALFVTGLRFDALRALEIGLVEAVEEPGDLDRRVDSIVAAILAGGPAAVNAAKRLVREVGELAIEDVLELTVERIARIRVSPEGQEGMRAFLERREPHW
jgi:methylglutaconyl-CoA hydratase